MTESHQLIYHPKKASEEFIYPSNEQPCNAADPCWQAARTGSKFVARLFCPKVRKKDWRIGSTFNIVQTYLGTVHQHDGFQASQRRPRRRRPPPRPRVMIIKYSSKTGSAAFSIMVAEK